SDPHGDETPREPGTAGDPVPRRETPTSLADSLGRESQGMKSGVRGEQRLERFAVAVVTRTGQVVERDRGQREKLERPRPLDGRDAQRSSERFERAPAQEPATGRVRVGTILRRPRTVLAAVVQHVAERAPELHALDDG